MAIIEQLSNGLLQTIFSYLLRRDLLSCRFVCQRWLDLPVPFAWEQIRYNIFSPQLDQQTEDNVLVRCRYTKHIIVYLSAQELLFPLSREVFEDRLRRFRRLISYLPPKMETLSVFDDHGTIRPQHLVPNGAFCTDYWHSSVTLSYFQTILFLEFERLVNKTRFRGGIEVEYMPFSNAPLDANLLMTKILSCHAASVTLNLVQNVQYHLMQPFYNIQRLFLRAVGNIAINEHKTYLDSLSTFDYEQLVLEGNAPWGLLQFPYTITALFINYDDNTVPVLSYPLTRFPHLRKCVILNNNNQFETLERFDVQARKLQSLHVEGFTYQAPTFQCVGSECHILENLCLLNDNFLRSIIPFGRAYRNLMRGKRHDNNTTRSNWFSFLMAFAPGTYHFISCTDPPGFQNFAGMWELRRTTSSDMRLDLLCLEVEEIPGAGRTLWAVPHYQIQWYRRPELCKYWKLRKIRLKRIPQFFPPLSIAINT